jgi:uncharacterized protein (TIGR02001 family)
VLVSSPAAAQVGTAISVFSDYRFRGYSLSDGRPVGIIDLSYDAPNGFYAALSGIGVATRNDGLEPLGIQLNAGYAKRLKSGVTLDLGAVHSNYSRYSSRTHKSYTEVYAGVSGKLISSRVYISPDYLNSGAWTLYGEVEGTVPAGSKLRFTGHVGTLIPLHSDDRENYRTEFDWRLGIARDFGRLSLHADLTGLQRGRDLYEERYHGRTAFVIGATYAL